VRERELVRGRRVIELEGHRLEDFVVPAQRADALPDVVHALILVTLDPPTTVGTADRKSANSHGAVAARRLRYADIMRRRMVVRFDGQPGEHPARHSDRAWFIDYLVRHEPPEGLGVVPEADPGELSRDDETEKILLIE